MAGGHELDIDQLEAQLMSHGVYLTELERDGGTVALEYESVHANGGVPHMEIGRVVNVFLDLLGEGTVGIEATVFDLDGAEQGSWRVRGDWLDELRAGALSETDFSAKVLDTIEER